MKLILFQRCRSEKDNSDGVDGNKIGATLVAREAHGIICRNFDRCVVAMCRVIENLHGDISYVLIGGQR